MPDPILYFNDSKMPKQLEGIPDAVYKALRTGLTRGRIVTIHYAANPAEVVTRDILPEVLFCYCNEWYVAAYCYLREEPRTFRLDRIQSAKVTRRSDESSGIAEDYRRNGIPWSAGNDRFQKFKCYDGTELEMIEPKPIWRTKTEREMEIRAATISLIKHAKSNRIDLIKEDLKAGADINSDCGSGETALTGAAEEGHLEAINFLLGKGADLHLRNGVKESALFCAAWSRKMDVVRYFVEEFHCDPNEKNRYGWSVLYAAWRNQDIAMMEYLLDHGADINTLDHENLSLLMSEAGSHNPEEIKVTICDFLLSHGADLSLVDRKGRSALFYAVNSGSEQLVRTMLTAGADANLADKEGITPLMLAPERCFDILLEYGAVPDASDLRGKTVAMYHAHDLRHIEILAKAGVDLHARDDAGNDVLMFAPNELGFMECLVEKYGFSVHDRNKMETLLHRCASSADPNPWTVQYLLEHGADPGVLNHNGRTPLEQLLQDNPYAGFDSWSAEGDCYDLLNSFQNPDFAALIRACFRLDLEKLQALLNECDRLHFLVAEKSYGIEDYNVTALSMALRAWCNVGNSYPAERIEAILDLLVALGADPVADPDHDGKSLLYVCLEQKKPELAEKYLQIWLSKQKSQRESLKWLYWYYFEALDPYPCGDGEYERIKSFILKKLKAKKIKVTRK